MTPSTVVPLADVDKPAPVKMEAVRGTQSTWQIQLENDDGTNPDTTSDVVEFTLSERTGGAERLTKTLVNVTPASGILSLTLTSTDLTFTGLSDDLDYDWRYAIRRQVGGVGSDEIVYLEGDFKLLATVSQEIP
jgi:hypothetical protein